ncbi:SusC/RagA family TonB-linked outer membrane protein [Filimonas lacunae]|uniref:SusC/RagA family TonB-linked outer membrane protein n=1 Tax=Filimonas lacunae TaxID=477680 RepID=UPI0013563D22|nr:SusC/RagA family TonB-linked outer membrane protein [Filimonas lacunae]
MACLLLTATAKAQQTSKTIIGKLLALDGSPQKEYVLQSKALKGKAVTAEDGRFTLQVNADDSVWVLYQDAQLGAFKVPEATSFQVQFAEKNTFKITPMAAPAADSTAKPATTVPPVDSAAKAPPKDTLPLKKNDPVAAAKPDSASATDTVYVTGTVQDINGKAISFATITFESGKTYSGKENGSFSIPFKAGTSVVFSAVGYSNKDVVLLSSTAPLTVQLSSKSGQQLQEVKVTAMGISKKGKAVGYSIQEIKGDAVQVAKEPNFVTALQGKLAGVQINGNTGSMSGSSKVTIRGNKSITGDNNALFVVDGIFMGNNNPAANVSQAAGGGGYDYGSPIQDINPDDIEQISVLKGAAASALYGSRGSNGVVLITTKRGSSSKKLGITYSLNAQMDKVYMRTKYQNRYGAGGASDDPSFVASGFDTLWYSQHPDQFLSGTSATYNDPIKGGYDLMPQYSIDESWGPELKGQVVRPYYSFDKDKNNPYFGKTTQWLPQPDNVKDFYRTGHTLTNSISVSGGSDKGTFRLSYSNLTQQFILPNSDLNRNNIGFNGTYKLNDAITAVASANYSNNRAKGRSGTGFAGTNPTQLFTMFGQRQLENDMLKYYAFPDGSQVSWNRKSFSDPTPTSATSPYWTAYNGYESDSRDRLFGLAGLEIKPTSWLNLSGKVFMDQFTTLIEERSPKDYQAGGYTRTDRTFREMNYLFLATVKKDLTKKLDINATVGGNIMTREDDINSGVVTGLIVPGLYTFTNTTSRVAFTEYRLNKRINSLFGDVTFGYNNSLFLNITGRNDWSSTLAKGHNSYFYPSASLSAMFSDWLKWNWLSFGKARVSVAEIGSDTDPYRTGNAYAQPGLFGTNPIISKDANLGNSNLLPEKSTEVEAGLELKFLNNRVGVDATVYTRTTRNLIVPLTVSAASGYNSFYANIGKSRTRGFELELTGRPIELKNSFAWDIAFNFSFNRSKLLKLDVPNNPDVTTYTLATERRLGSVSVTAIEGQPLFAITGTDYTYDSRGNKMVDSSGHYIKSAPGQIIGTTQPDFIGGISNTFSYKNISLSALIDFQKGGNFFSYTNLYGLYSGTLQETVENNIRETGIIVPGVGPDGNANTVKINAANHFKTNYGRSINKANLYDAGFVYLREVRLGYSLPEKWVSKIKAANARLSLYGRNLWLIHANAPNVDPSNILNSDLNIQGLEGGALPSVRSYGINLSIGF